MEAEPVPATNVGKVSGDPNIDYRRLLDSLEADEVTGRADIEVTCSDATRFVHPSFPFTAGAALAVFEEYFSCLGTNSDNTIDPEVAMLLLEGVIMKKIEVRQPQTADKFKKVITPYCGSESAMLERMQAVVAKVNSQLLSSPVNAPSVLKTGFWAHKCVLPAVSEAWQRVWVTCDDITLSWAVENSSRSQGTIPIVNLVDAHLSCMTSSKAPRKFFRNGVTLQLNRAANPLQLVLCCEVSENAHKLLKHIRHQRLQAAKAELQSMQAALSILPQGVAVWSCRSGFNRWTRSLWVVDGDRIIHKGDGDSESREWPLQTINSVSLAISGDLSPPLKYKSYGFSLLFAGGSLFCCAESYSGRDEIVGAIKKALVRQQMTPSSPKRFDKQSLELPGASPKPRASPIRKE
eukprot:GILI01012144.1.p1 GENE.GILI01012144.1~~GILI01012144.1.p1  ORF type:complete len:451 (+),score=43.42 GILI01012144.1:137-1354(+)